MEPERKIEKLLRAFARKRRADAGDPLTLHPANRRRLQDEVARRAREADEEGSSLSLGQLFRRDWAFLLGFAMLVFFFATLTLPSLSSAKKKAQSAATANNLKQIGMAMRIAADENGGRLPASLETLTNGFLDDPFLLTDPRSGKPFVYIAGGETLDGLQSNAVLAYSAEDKNGRMVLFADGRVERADPASLEKLQLADARRRDRDRNFEQRVAASPQVAAGLATNSIAVNGQVAAAPASESARRAITVAQDALALRAASVPTEHFTNRAVSTLGAVLKGFQVQQDGAAIIVRDDDGSIYRGAFDAPVPFQGSGKEMERPIPATRPFSFVGTNQVLNRKIMFDGYFVTSSPEAQPRFRVIGTVIIGGTNRMDVNAVPSP